MPPIERSSREGPSLAQRFSSVLMLGASLLVGTAVPVFAQNRSSAVRAGPRGAPPQMRTGRTNATSMNRSVDVNGSRAVYMRRNTVVRPAPRPYARPPYAYRGRRYYAYHPYGYHRYAPYSWGPAFHPIGFVAATMAATAIAVTLANEQYQYDQGVWYAPAPSGGYAVVPAPLGATVVELPPGAVMVNPSTYYSGGTYYEQGAGGYLVVAPEAGTVVDQLPPGGEEVTIGSQSYVKFGETIYQPFEEDGQPKYEVVQIR
jgi:hypothetical protein